MPEIIKDEKKFIELMDIIYEQYHKVRDDRDDLRKKNYLLNKEIIKLNEIINILRNNNIDN
tara:strand:- start:1713 stop:1895 length:183 start_codon:yes stop_codon:yes gene_type:complete